MNFTKTELLTPVQKFCQDFKSLDSSGLLASPKSGRQHFFIDLWNAIVEVSSQRIEKSSRFIKHSGEHSLAIYPAQLTKLNIHEPMVKLVNQSWEHWESNHGFHIDTVALKECVHGENDVEFFNELDWELKFRDGMLVLVEGGISRVICIMDELFFAQEAMVEELLSVVYLSKLTGASVAKIQKGIEEVCGFDVITTAQDKFTGSEFIDFSNVANFDECLRIIRYFDCAPVVILGGEYCALPQLLEEQLIASEASLIHIIETPKAQDPFLRRFIDVYQVADTSEAIRTVYEITEEASEILYFGGIERSQSSRSDLSQAFLKEVMA